MTHTDSTEPGDGTPARRKGLAKGLLIGIGTVCVVLGFIGMFIPVLPTTPFLLVAAACYIRSSERFYHWLVTNRWCGEYIRNYRAGNGIPLRAKIVSGLLLWLTIGYSAGFVVTLWWVKIILLGIAIAVTTHLMRIKTLKSQTQ